MNYGSGLVSGYGSSYGSDIDIEEIFAIIAGVMATLGGVILVTCLISLLILIALWSIFKKAGKKGWESFIPAHNTFVMLELGGLSGAYYFISLLLPPVGLIVLDFMMNINLAHSFGKSTGFGIGLVFLPFIFYPMLAWGSATYVGPNGVAPAQANVPPQNPPAQPQ